MTEDKTTTAPWKKIAEIWNTVFTPPSRVSKDEAEKYKEWLKEIKKPGIRVLLLGVTPEIRDSLAELDIETVCIDINKEMILAMNSLLKTKNPKEKIVIENWLENTLEDDSFDVVIGDCVLSNVKWEERDKLLSEVKRVLKPNGIFMTRFFSVPREKPFKTLDEILQDYEKREPNYRTALEFIFDMQIFCYNSEDHKGTFTEPKKELEKIRVGDSFNLPNENLNKLLDMVWGLYCIKYVDKIYYYPYRDEEEERLENFFEILKIFEAKDNRFSKETPLFLLKLKS